MAPLFFVVFDVFDGLCWFFMVFHVFKMCFHVLFMFFPSVFLELSLYKMENMGRTWGNPLQNPKHRSKTRKGLYKIQNWSLLGWALTGLEPVFWIAWHSLATTKFQTTGRRLAPTSTCYQKQPLQNGKHGQKKISTSTKS